MKEFIKAKEEAQEIVNEVPDEEKRKLDFYAKVFEKQDEETKEEVKLSRR